MTTDLPDPHGCPHCGHAGLAERWGETICGMCHAPRVHATPGCPVRNVMAGWEFAQRMRQVVQAWPDWKRRAAASAFCSPTAIETRQESVVATANNSANNLAALVATPAPEQCAPSTTAETARERRVHDGGPRINP